MHHSYLYKNYKSPRCQHETASVRLLPRWIIWAVIIIYLFTASVSLVGAEAQASQARSSGLVYLGTLGSVATKTSASEFIIETELPVTTGDDILVALATDPNANMVITIEDLAGNTYQQIGDTVINTGEIRTYLFAAYDVNSMPAGSQITITDSTAVAAHAAAAMLFTGLAEGDPFDATAANTDTGTAPSSGAAPTTSQDEELLIGLVGTEGPGGDEPGAWDGAFIAGPRIGTTGGDDDSNITIAMGYRLVSASGEYSAGKTGITERDWTALIATFKADIGGPRPSIYLTGTPLDIFTTRPGDVSDEQTYTVSGDDLTEAITITAPADFEISLSSGSGFTSELQLEPTGGVVSETPIYVRFSLDYEGDSSGSIAHASAGATTRNIPVSGTSGPLYPVEFNIMLARPTDHSITANIIPDFDVDFYVEYGTTSGIYSDQTGIQNAAAADPVEFVIDGLDEDTRYYYRIVYTRAGTEETNNGSEHSFITQRSSDSSFTFTVIADSHLGQYGGQDADELALYEVTLQNVLLDNPDFHIDLGDTFAMDPSPLGTGMTMEEADAAYYIQRPYLAAITDSIPYFQVIGNHENEEGWNFDDVFTAPDQSLAIAGMTARKKYIPIPIPDDFYSGNEDPLAEPIGGDTYHEDYYAWEWGDALLVVLDPYHYSMTWPDDFGEGYGGEGQDGEASGDRWDWTLGIEQYLWFKETLETSTAKYKFVFSHHVTGGSTPYGRGGIGAAPYFEWGGYNADDTWGWDIERPASEGWDVPIHQLMVNNGVDVFFHGHDHIYSYEELDGVVYLECPKPDDAGYDWQPYGYGYNENLYPDGINIQNSGYIRVTVTPDDVTVKYVRSYLPGDGENGAIAHTFTIEPEGILGDVNGDSVVDSTDSLVILTGDAGFDITEHCPVNCGDVNGDGYVNSTDATILLTYNAGLSVPYPVGSAGCPATEPICAGCSP